MGKTLEDPIVEAVKEGEVLFLAANVEHQCENLTIHHYKIYLEGLESFAEPRSCLEGWEIVRAGIEGPDQGLPDKLLNRVDVLVWWGHKRHRELGRLDIRI